MKVTRFKIGIIALLIAISAGSSLIGLTFKGRTGPSKTKTVKTAQTRFDSYLRQTSKIKSFVKRRDRIIDLILAENPKADSMAQLDEDIIRLATDYFNPEEIAKRYREETVKENPLHEGETEAQYRAYISDMIKIKLEKLKVDKEFADEIIKQVKKQMSPEPSTEDATGGTPPAEPAPTVTNPAADEGGANDEMDPLDQEQLKAKITKEIANAKASLEAEGITETNPAYEDELYTKVRDILMAEFQAGQIDEAALVELQRALFTETHPEKGPSASETGTGQTGEDGAEDSGSDFSKKIEDGLAEARANIKKGDLSEIAYENRLYKYVNDKYTPELQSDPATLQKFRDALFARKYAIAEAEVSGQVEEGGGILGKVGERIGELTSFLGKLGEGGKGLARTAWSVLTHVYRGTTGLANIALARQDPEAELAYKAFVSTKTFIESLRGSLDFHQAPANRHLEGRTLLESMYLYFVDEASARFSPFTKENVEKLKEFLIEQAGGDPIATISMNAAFRLLQDDLELPEKAVFKTLDIFDGTVRGLRKFFTRIRKRFTKRTIDPLDTIFDVNMINKGIKFVADQAADAARRKWQDLKTYLATNKAKLKAAIERTGDRVADVFRPARDVTSYVTRNAGELISRLITIVKTHYSGDPAERDKLIEQIDGMYYYMHELIIKKLMDKSTDLTVEELTLRISNSINYLKTRLKKLDLSEATQKALSSNLEDGLYDVIGTKISDDILREIDPNDLVKHDFPVRLKDAALEAWEHAPLDVLKRISFETPEATVDEGDVFFDPVGEEKIDFGDAPPEVLEAVKTAIKNAIETARTKNDLTELSTIVDSVPAEMKGELTTTLTNAKLRREPIDAFSSKTPAERAAIESAWADVPLPELLTLLSSADGFYDAGDSDTAPTTDHIVSFEHAPPELLKAVATGIEKALKNATNVDELERVVEIARTIPDPDLASSIGDAVRGQTDVIKATALRDIPFDIFSEQSSTTRVAIIKAWDEAPIEELEDFTFDDAPEPIQQAVKRNIETLVANATNTLEFDSYAEIIATFPEGSIKTSLTTTLADRRTFIETSQTMLRSFPLYRADFAKISENEQKLIEEAWEHAPLATLTRRITDNLDERVPDALISAIQKAIESAIPTVKNFVEVDELRAVITNLPKGMRTGLLDSLNAINQGLEDEQTKLRKIPFDKFSEQTEAEQQKIIEAWENATATELTTGDFADAPKELLNVLTKRFESLVKAANKIDLAKLQKTFDTFPDGEEKTTLEQAAKERHSVIDNAKGVGTGEGRGRGIGFKTPGQDHGERTTKAPEKVITAEQLRKIIEDNAYTGQTLDTVGNHFAQLQSVATSLSDITDLDEKEALIKLLVEVTEKYTKSLIDDYGAWAEIDRRRLLERTFTLELKFATTPDELAKIVNDVNRAADMEVQIEKDDWYDMYRFSLTSDALWKTVEARVSDLVEEAKSPEDLLKLNDIIDSMKTAYQKPPKEGEEAPDPEEGEESPANVSEEIKKALQKKLSDRLEARKQEDATFESQYITARLSNITTLYAEVTDKLKDPEVSEPVKRFSLDALKSSLRSWADAIKSARVSFSATLSSLWKRMTKSTDEAEAEAQKIDPDAANALAAEAEGLDNAVVDTAKAALADPNTSRDLAAEAHAILITIDHDQETIDAEKAEAQANLAKVAEEFSYVVKRFDTKSKKGYGVNDEVQKFVLEILVDSVSAMSDAIEKLPFAEKTGAIWEAVTSASANMQTANVNGDYADLLEQLKSKTAELTDAVEKSAKNNDDPKLADLATRVTEDVTLYKTNQQDSTENEGLAAEITAAEEAVTSARRKVEDTANELSKKEVAAREAKALVQQLKAAEKDHGAFIGDKAIRDAEAKAATADQEETEAREAHDAATAELTKHEAALQHDEAEAAEGDGAEGV